MSSERQGSHKDALQLEGIYAKINNVSLVILAMVAVGFCLYVTKSVVLPFVISLFLYLLVVPLLDYMQIRLKIPRFISIVISIILFVLFFVFLFFFVTDSVQEIIESAKEYQEKFIQFIDWTAVFLNRFGYETNSETITAQLKSLPYFTAVRNVTGSVFSFLGTTTLVFIFLMFLIVGKKKVEDHHPIFDEINFKILRYVRTKLFTSTLTGVLVGLSLFLAGLDLWLMLAVLTFLLNFIPSIGSLIAVVLPIPVALIQFDLTLPFYVVLLVPSIFQFTIGNIVEPRMMGQSLELHPIAILIFLMFWGLVWGIPGMFLAVPITSILKIIFNRIETTKPLVELLAGRLPRDVKMRL